MHLDLKDVYLVGVSFGVRYILVHKEKYLTFMMTVVIHNRPRKIVLINTPLVLSAITVLHSVSNVLK